MGIRRVAVVVVAAALVGGGCGSSSDSSLVAGTGTSGSGSGSTEVPEGGTVLEREATTSSTHEPSPPATSPPPSISTSTSTLPFTTTGVHGQVTAGPTCPVEREDQPCPPSPVRDTRIDALGAGERVAGSAVTDDDGRYAITLEPGDYTLRVVVDGMFPSCPDTPVRITGGPPATADIDCDTGIR